MNKELLRRVYVALNNAHSELMGHPNCFDENYSAQVLLEIGEELKNTYHEKIAEDIIYDLQSYYDTYGIEDDEGSPLIYLGDAICAVEEAFRNKPTISLTLS